MDTVETDNLCFRTNITNVYLKKDLRINVSNNCSVARRPFPAGDRVTFNGKDCLCQCCVQPTSPTPKDVSTASSESQTLLVLLGYVLVSYSDYIWAKSLFIDVLACVVLCVLTDLIPIRSQGHCWLKAHWVSILPERPAVLAKRCAKSHSPISDFSFHRLVR